MNILKIARRIANTPHQNLPYVESEESAKFLHWDKVDTRIRHYVERGMLAPLWALCDDMCRERQMKRAEADELCAAAKRVQDAS